MACTHPSDYLLINFFNKDVVWDAGFLEGFFWRGRGGSLTWQFNSYVLSAMHWKCSTDKVPKMTSRSLSCWGEGYPRFVCPGEAKCGHRYVLVFRLSSDCKSCGRNKTDLRAARQNKCESAYSVSLFQGWQWERLTFFLLCWWNFMKCKFCGWFLV